MIHQTLTMKIKGFKLNSKLLLSLINSKLRESSHKLNSSIHCPKWHKSSESMEINKITNFSTMEKWHLLHPHIAFYYPGTEAFCPVSISKLSSFNQSQISLENQPLNHFTQHLIVTIDFYIAVQKICFHLFLQNSNVSHSCSSHCIP